MGYSASKGLIAFPIGFSGGEYEYRKLSYKYIQPTGYASTPNQMQDLDSYVNGNGYLKRTVLAHSRTKIEWNTPYLTYDNKCALIAAINNGFKYGVGDKSERKIRVRYYNDLVDDYSHGNFYIPDITFTNGGIYHGAPLYQPIRIALIEY